MSRDDPPVIELRSAMCNLYSNTMPVAAMRQLFAVDASNDQLGNAEPLPAIFPKGNAPVVALTDDGQRALWNTHWGFVLPQVSKKTGKPIQVNDRFGKKTMVLASEGMNRPWKLRSDHKSPRYTTRLSDLPVVR